MVKIWQLYTHKRPHVPYKDREEAARDASSSQTCTSLYAAAGATLSHIRLLSCSNQLRLSTEVVPLPSTTYADSLHALSMSARCGPPLDDSVYGVDHVDALRLHAPCACRDAAMLASGTEEHACMEQLLYNPSIQGKTWRMLGSLAKSSPFGSGAQARRGFGMTCGRSGGDVTKILAHGSLVFTVHQDHKIRVWKLSTSSSSKHKLLNTLPTATDYFLNCFCQDNYVQVRRHHHCLWIQHADVISALAVGGVRTSSDNVDGCIDHELLYSASWDKTFKVWRLSDFKCMESIVAHNDAVNAIILHQQLVYTASSDGTVKAWTKEDINITSRLRRTKKIKHRLVGTLPDHKCAVNALSISNDGEFLFSAGSDGSIRMWKRLSGNHRITAAQCVHTTLCSVLEGHKRAVLCLCIAGDLLLSGSSDKSLRAWSIGRLEEKLSSDNNDGDSDNMNKSCIAIMQGHKAPIVCVCASPCLHGSGYIIYSGALDMAVKVWWLPHPQ